MKIFSRICQIIFILIIYFCFQWVSHAATIESSGWWNWLNPSTWVGWVIPTSSDDVIINGGVQLVWDISIASLTVTASWGLSHGEYRNRNINIYGDFINHWNVNVKRWVWNLGAGRWDYYYRNFQVYGDIINTWNMTDTNLYIRWNLFKNTGTIVSDIEHSHERGSNLYVKTSWELSFSGTTIGFPVRLTTDVSIDQTSTFQGFTWVIMT